VRLVPGVNQPGGGGPPSDREFCLDFLVHEGLSGALGEQKQEQFCRGYAAVSASGSPDRRRRPTILVSKPREERMAADSVYKVIELIGTSSESWEKAARTAVERAAESLRDLRIAEVTAQDVQLKDGKVELFRTKLKVSFKYEKGSD
jgi:dodecin